MIKLQKITMYCLHCFKTHPNINRVLRPSLLRATAIAFLLSSPLSLAETQSAPEFNREQQRALYSKIKQDLDSGSLNPADVPYQQLGNYPLAPYLQFRHLSKTLASLPVADVDTFLSEQENSWLGDRLRRQWLDVLAKKKQWQAYQSYYRPEIASSEQKCWSVEARINMNEPGALADAGPLWNQGKSLPKACDDLFKQWLNSEYFSTDVAWQRYYKAVENRNLSLARYIRSLLDEQQLVYADSLVNLYHYPSRLSRLHKFREFTSETEDLIHYGTRRYARHNSLAALKQWQLFDSKHLLDAGKRNDTVEYLSYRLILNGHPDTAQMLLERNQVVSLRITERLLRDALKATDWPEVARLIQTLPIDEQETHRWRYWANRAAEVMGTRSRAEITEAYWQLAADRDFYGFLSADRVDVPYSLSHRSAEPDPALVTELALLPAIERAKELFLLGSLNQARMEWRYGTRELQGEQLLAAAKLSHTWGWHRKTIESLGQARFWDDLDLRFPLIYRSEVNQAAQASALQPQLLLAVARQESAFAADAQSPAGALGLMQLMPATAKQTAKSIGVKHSRRDLLKPDHNILLGSTYLSQMLERFNGNRILAAAAYNAGPHRVQRWLNNEGSQVDYDVWIETIPFKETRGYVQNVLSYSLIYSHLMGTELQLLAPNEVEQPL